MKNLSATHFPELITSLDYENPIIKKIFWHHLKNTPLAGRVINFVSNWSKLTNDKEILQIVKGLKIQFLKRSSPKATCGRNKNVSGWGKFIGHRSSGIIEEVRNNTCSSIRGSICQQHFFWDRKKKWSFSPDYKFEKIEPVHSIFAFQNGRPKTAKRSSKGKQSNGKNRSQRCLLQHSPASRNTEVCKVSMERESISIPMSLFWSGICFQDLHQTFENSYINSTENKHLIDNLPRWYSNYVEESGGNLNESRHSNISTPTSRFCNKSTEIQIGTKHKTRIFRGRNEFGGHDNVPPREESNGYNQSVQQTLIGGKYNSEGINKSNWKIDFNISSSPPSSSTFSLITNASDNKAEGQPLQQRQSKSKCSLIRGTKVAAPQSELQQRKTYKNSKSSRMQQNRRLGGTLTGAESRGSVEQGGSTTPHKCFWNESRQIGDRVILQGKKPKSVHLQIDNVTALSHLMKMGWTKTAKLNKLLKEIWEYLIGNNIALTSQALKTFRRIGNHAMQRTQASGNCVPRHLQGQLK